jgi:hypothetical protein
MGSLPTIRSFQIQQAGHRGGGLALERRLAPTGYALIGLDFYEDIGPVCLRDPLIERHAEDAHIGNAQFGSHIAKCGSAGRLVFGRDDLRRAAAIVQRRRARPPPPGDRA